MSKTPTVGRDPNLIPLVIIGAGGHGREALDIVFDVNEEAPAFEFLGFIDDARIPGTPALPHDASILGGLEYLRRMPNIAYLPAVGDPVTRSRIVDSLPEHLPADLIHPLASIGSHVRHGPGLIMAAGARITHGVTLGAHVHINVNATVSHDCQFGNFVTVTPGVNVSGNVTVGDAVWLGVSATVKQGVTIGDGATLGAGAVAITNIPDGCTAIGVPARPAKAGRNGEQHR